MNYIRRRTILGSGIALVAPINWAATYPAKPIRIILGYAAGGTMDILARLVAQRLSELVKQPVIVDNRTGANGTIAGAAVKNAEPDGYTLHVSTSSSLTLFPLLQKGLPYDADRDFAPLASIARAPLVLTIPADLPANNLAEFIAYLKATKNTSFGTTGSGQIMHAFGLLLQDAVGVKMIHVPFKGEVPALVELMGGRLTAVFSTVSGVLPHLAGGKLKAIAVTDFERSSALPQVPTMREAGLPGLELAVRYILLTRAGVSPAIFNRLEELVVQILREPETIRKITAMGITPESLGASGTAEMLKREAVMYRGIVTKFEVTLD